jgi:hypothetical protein
MLYKSSKGDREIADMPLPYAKNALGKLMRDEPSRTAEIEALQAHVDKLSADVEADAANPRAVIGGNNPPEETPAPNLKGRDAIDAHVADILTEAGNWGDGVAVTDQGQADVVGRLHRMLQEAATLVDDAATKEKKPHNKALTEIGNWQNSYTAKGLKKTPDGKLTKALAATGNLSSAWLRKQDDERREREKIAADLAHKAAQEAIALREEAKVTTDIAVMDRAEDALTEARNLIGIATGLGKERVRVGGGDGFRAMSLRSSWSAHISSEPGSWGQAYAHYKTNPEFMSEFHALIQRWADRDARIEASRLRGVPGFNFIEEKVAA